jgi:hypothetical protein
MKTAIALVLAFLVAGCSETSPGAIDVSGSGGFAEVKIVTMQDGTKCAVLSGYKKGGIDCDWGQGK